MNSNCMLQNFVQSSAGFNFADAKPKKSARGNSHELQLQIGIIYNEISQILDEVGIRIQMKQDPSRTTDKVNMFKTIVQQLVVKMNPDREICNDSNIISCPDCQVYEASLQKLQNQVRQHIRLEQQLKIFQDTQDEKLDEYKKERKDMDRKVEQVKRQLEESKKDSTVAHERMSKLQHQNEQYKKQMRDMKRNISTNTHHDSIHTKREGHKNSGLAHESKQNKIDWVHRNVSVKRDEKDKGYQRKSIEKRGDSAEKNWRMSNNAKSNKMMSVMNDKMVQQKTRDERRRAIQSKFDYRR